MTQTPHINAIYIVDELLRRLAQHVYREIWLRVPVTITESQFFLCRFVYQYQRLTVSELAELKGVSLSAVTVSANKLCQRGILRRVRGKRDRRVVWLTLTAEGEQLVEKTLEAWHGLLYGYLQALPPEDLEQLTLIAEKLLTNLSREEQPVQHREWLL